MALFRYGTGILQWSELKNVDRKSRKTMTMYGALHTISDVDRLYIRRKDYVEVRNWLGKNIRDDMTK